MAKKSQHTPAPWRPLIDSKRTHPSKRMALVATPNGKAAIDCSRSGEGYAQDCANARLIAAAPDLLDALHRMLAMCEAMMPGVPYIVMDIGELNSSLIATRQAIAKATGEPADVR